ncbi:MAG: universal stress protein [Candidatus Sulfotelmatobacter sp.]|jgi:nucleotide-binding universal stress UspA family protein
MSGRRHNLHFWRILIGYDGSPQSEKAVELGFSLAGCIDSTVLILAVARPPEPPTSVELEAVLDDAREHYEEGFKKILEKARAHDLDVKTDMAVGHPGEQIIHRAEEDGIDLIILGRRGRSMLSRMVLGSVSERVLRYAHCPVMVVH